MVFPLEQAPVEHFLDDPTDIRPRFLESDLILSHHGIDQSADAHAFRFFEAAIQKSADSLR